jgi:hypothetical protein
VKKKLVAVSNTVVVVVVARLMVISGRMSGWISSQGLPRREFVKSEWEGLPFPAFIEIVTKVCMVVL